MHLMANLQFVCFVEFKDKIQYSQEKCRDSSLRHVKHGGKCRFPQSLSH